MRVFVGGLAGILAGCVLIIGGQLVAIWCLDGFDEMRDAWRDQCQAWRELLRRDQRGHFK